MENKEATATALRKIQVQGIIDKLMSGEGKLSYSSLSAFRESPKSFIDYKLKQRIETPAMIYGSMVHCLVLEPEKFELRYHAIDDEDICNSIGGAKPRATKAYKEWYAIAEQEAGERILVDTDDWNAAKIVANGVRYNRATSKILGLCEAHETPVQWEYKNFSFQGIMDGYGQRAVFDLKTVADAEPRKVQRDIYQNWYYMQAAMYLHGLGYKDEQGIKDMPYYIIAADKIGGVSVHHLDYNLIIHGLNEYSNLIDKFNLCVLKECWNESYEYWSERFDGIFVCDKPSYFY
jgi:hypothetical protein